MEASHFDREYRRLYLPLCMYALRLLGDSEDARDAVSDAFASVWVRLFPQPEPDNFRAYMYRAVHNSCMMRLRHRNDVQLESIATIDNEQITDLAMLTAERDAAVWNAIDSLPPRTREVFLMAKRDGMSYDMIATEMEISVKTVENQMTRAFKTLRLALHPYSGHKNLPAVIMLPWL